MNWEKYILGLYLGYNIYQTPTEKLLGKELQHWKFSYYMWHSENYAV